MIKNFADVNILGKSPIQRDESLPQLTTEPVYICNRCGKSYKYKKTLNRHARQECGRTAAHLCPYCPKKFKRKDIARDHIRNVHTRR